MDSASGGLRKALRLPLPDHAHLAGLWIEYLPQPSSEALPKIEVIPPSIREQAVQSCSHIVWGRERKGVKYKEKTLTGVCLFPMPISLKLKE